MPGPTPDRADNAVSPAGDSDGAALAAAGPAVRGGYVDPDPVFQQIYRTTFKNQRGEVVCEADSWCFRTERETARERSWFESV